MILLILIFCGVENRFDLSCLVFFLFSVSQTMDYDLSNDVIAE